MSKHQRIDPTTDEELQTAVDLAEGAMRLDSARKYGLVKGGPDVDLERCEAIIQMGRKRGIRPHPDAAERFVAAHFR